MAAENGKPTISANTDQEKASYLSQEKATVPQNNGHQGPGASISAPRPPYSALSAGRRRFILGIVTAAGFFGPLAGGIYLPALPTLQNVFNTSATTINATVSVFMAILAVAVCVTLPNEPPYTRLRYCHCLLSVHIFNHR